MQKCSEAKAKLEIRDKGNKGMGKKAVIAMVKEEWEEKSPPPDLLIDVKVDEFDAFSLFKQEKML